MHSPVNWLHYSNAPRQVCPSQRFLRLRKNPVGKCVPNRNQTFPVDAGGVDTVTHSGQTDISPKPQTATHTYLACSSLHDAPPLCPRRLTHVRHIGVQFRAAGSQRSHAPLIDFDLGCGDDDLAVADSSDVLVCEKQKGYWDRDRILRAWEDGHVLDVKASCSLDGYRRYSCQDWARHNQQDQSPPAHGVALGCAIGPWGRQRRGLRPSPSKNLG